MLSCLNALAKSNGDSTNISVRLKPRQSTGMYYYDNNYQNRRVVFQNPTDTTITVTKNIFIDLPTEFRHSTLHSVSGKSISTLQHFYLEPGSKSNWVLRDNYDLAPSDSTSKYKTIETVGKTNKIIHFDSTSFASNKQLANYLTRIKAEFIENNKATNRLYFDKQISIEQSQYWKMVFECDYFNRFLTVINQNPKFQVPFKIEIDNQIAYFLSKISEYDTLRFVGVVNAGAAILYYKAQRNFADNFNIASDFAIKNLGETAVQNLITIMELVPEIGQEKYKKSIEQIKAYANPMQFQYIEVFTNRIINNPEHYRLETKDTNRIKTLKALMDENKGKLILIDFWASWCVPCRAESPFLRQIQKKFKNKKVAFIGISLDEDDKSNEWLRAMKADKIDMDTNQYRLQSPKSSRLTQLVNLRSIPKYILLDIDGEILNKDFLRPSDKDFEVELGRYLAKYEN